jgi:hypothetical protein
MAWNASLVPPRRRPRRSRRTRRRRPSWLPVAGGGGGGGGGTPQNSTWTESARGIVWIESNRSRTWSAPAMTILTKRAGETRLYTMDFSNMPEIVGGDTLTGTPTWNCISAVGTGGKTSDLAFTSPALHAGNKGADVKIAGGVDGVTYGVSASVTTAAGYTLVGIGYLYIDDR